MHEDRNFRRKQARQTIVSALRIVRDIQRDYRFPTSEVVKALARLYLNIGFYDSFRWLNYASQQIKKDESRGGH
jgi:hypothetical protein